MNAARTIFLLMLALGLAATASFHSSGALDERDALTAAALHGGATGSPPAPVTSRALGLGVGLVRIVWAPTGLFRSMHLAAGAMLAVAAGLGAVAAFRLARSGAGALAAALFVGVATLFGGELGRHGLAGSPVATVVALLAGAAAAWTRPAPAAYCGGLLLGLATADHPFVLFLLPGFAMLARSVAGPGFARRAALGFATGLLALFLPVWDSGGRLGAVAAWASAGDGAFWSPGGPRRWADGLLALLVSWGRSAGPAGIACLAGAGLVARGRGDRRQRALVALAAVPAVAIVLGRPADAPVAAAVAGWTLLLLAIPIADELAARIGARVSAVGFASGLLVLALSWTSIDRSPEREIVWSRKAFDVLPEGSLLLTGDPVHLALVADGERPDVDVVWVRDPSTLVSRDSVRIVHAPPLRTGARIDGAFLHEVAGLNHGQRNVLVDPRVFFDVETRLALLGDRFRAVPHGLAYRLVTEDERLLDQDAVEAKALWDDVDLNQRTPPSPLRDGKTAGQWYARSLLQAGSLYLDFGLEQAAERDFLLLLTMDEANHSLAALGFARVLHMRHSFPEVIRTLQDHARESDEGAWLAYQFLGNTCVLEQRWEEAIAALETAVRLAPPEAAGPRGTMERSIGFARGQLGGRAS
jgi:hypothetical protein